jgi:transketolase
MNFNNHFMTFEQYRELIPTKTGFAAGLLEAGQKNSRVVCLGTDITASVGMDLFANHCSERFLSLGIAEQNAAGVAAGLALMNKIPVFSTYGVFSAFRSADQIRVSICYNNLQVIIGGAHAGLSVGPDGATHQALEDMAVMRVLPNMTVLSPCDATQTKLAVIAAVEQVKGPCYIRYGRSAVPDFSAPEQIFEVGKGQILRSGKDVCIIATGHLTWQALQASNMLKSNHIDAMVINIHTIKPLDEELILNAAEYCGAIVSCEEHQVAGGLGSAIGEVILRNQPVPMEFVGVYDSFGESGTPDELWIKYRLDKNSICKAVNSVLKRK